MPTPSPGLAILQRVLLIPLGVALIARAAQVATEPDIISPERALLHPLIPLWLRVTLWATTGALAILCGVFGYESAGYAAAGLMPAERTLSYGWSTLQWAIPGDPPGNVTSAAWLGWWAGITVLALAIAVSPVLVPWIRTWPHQRRGSR